MRTKSVVLERQTANDLHKFIKENIPNREVIQVLPTSPLLMCSRAGEYSCDYLLMYKED